MGSGPLCTNIRKSYSVMPGCDLAIMRSKCAEQSSMLKNVTIMICGHMVIPVCSDV